MSNRLGEYIRQARSERGWTQKAVAGKAELSVDTIRRVESTGRCSSLTLAALAEAFEVPQSRLRDLKDSPDREINADAGSRGSEPPERTALCRWCAGPVSTHGIVTRPVGEGETELQIRSANADDGQSYWSRPPDVPAYYCSVECLARRSALTFKIMMGDDVSHSPRRRGDDIKD